MIGQQVCFHSDRKLENGVNNMVGCFRVLRIYSFMKETEMYIRASYIVFLFVKTAKFVRILKQVKTSDGVSGFHWSALEFSQTAFASVFTGLWRHGERKWKHNCWQNIYRKFFVLLWNYFNRLIMLFLKVTLPPWFLFTLANMSGKRKKKILLKRCSSSKNVESHDKVMEKVFEFQKFKRLQVMSYCMSKHRYY